MQQDRNTLVVFGAATSFGKVVVKELSDSGRFNIRAIFTYPNEKNAEEELQGMKMVHPMDVDVSDKAAVAKAIQGAQGVWLGQSHHQTRDAAAELKVAQNVIEGIKEAAATVRFAVYLSVGAADKHASELWWKVKLQIEDLMKKTQVPTLILRPAFFVDNFSRILKSSITTTGELQLPLPGDKPVQMVSYRDIARISRVAFENPEKWLNKTLELASDEVTMDEVCNAIGQKLGKPIKFTPLAMSDATKSFGHCPQFVAFDYAADVSNLKKAMPFEMMSFKEWIHTTPLA